MKILTTAIRVFSMFMIPDYNNTRRNYQIVVNDKVS